MAEKSLYPTQKTRVSHPLFLPLHPVHIHPNITQEPPHHVRHAAPTPPATVRRAPPSTTAQLHAPTVIPTAPPPAPFTPSTHVTTPP